MHLRTLIFTSIFFLISGCNQSDNQSDDGGTIKTAGVLEKTTASELTTYFRESLADGIGASQNITDDSTAEDVSAAPGQSEDAGRTNDFSNTQLQEIGVDESDLLKSNGKHVYRVVNDGDQWGASAPNKIAVFELSNNGRNLTALTEINSEEDSSFTDIYLDDERQQLIALETNARSVWGNWFVPEYFIANDIALSVIDISDPSNANVTDRLSFDGALVDSRRVGDTLYLVLRYFPSITPWHPYARTDDERAQNVSTLNDLSALDLLPSFTRPAAGPASLVNADDCYINRSSANHSGDIITLVALDLANPTITPVTQCYVGHSEAIYASTHGLYLASTRWDYDWTAPEDSYDPKTTTDIHKFAFTDGGFEYRGSAEIGGHLGFDQNRKSFRFSEHDGYLRVMTINEQRPWLGLTVDLAEPAAIQAATVAEVSSPVMLTVLQESDTKNALKQVAQLPNEKRPEPIGKEGEQLYATRYVGDRAYAVTFRVTDPLYVLDLSDPADPFIAGELEIDGYSDYLFPLSENLMLGVGKDAVPDETGWGDQRGAWYQGVKLSLIDVTDPANPVESDRRILGQRGTEAAVLSDHHGISLLNTDSETRIALPVSLHDRAPSYGLSGEPWQHYAYTHTALYRFTVPAGSNTFAEVGLAPLVAHQASGDDYGVDYTSDRALLVEDAVHYFHRDTALSQDWLGEQAIDTWP